VFQIFVPLAVGAAVVMVQDALELASTPTDVSLVNMVPSALRSVIASGTLSEGVRRVNLGGEVLPPDLLAQLFADTGLEDVRNHWGPTETTITSTCGLLRRGEDSPITIGRPIGNTRVYILDSSGR
ncbi:AMP-binding protein, partial [Streptomyces sp. NRRL S-813]|uniref:AMP-binding protein n=1 Tax=Streptomyces sp. NRRL S-813 TaxID=1463919 RepID=UPI00055F35D4